MTSLYTQPYTSWAHRLARLMVRPLVGTRVTPNHLTTARLVTGVVACLGFALGTVAGNFWGGGLWVVSCLLDRADGELARLARLSSPGGHFYDYCADVAVNSSAFAAIGIGLRGGPIGRWAPPALGLLASATIALASVLSEKLERAGIAPNKAYPGILSFDFDDALYLLAPLAWLDGLVIVLIGGAIAGPIFAALTAWRLHQLPFRPEVPPPA